MGPVDQHCKAKTLREQLSSQGALAPPLALSYLSQLAATIDDAHALGVGIGEMRLEDIAVDFDDRCYLSGKKIFGNDSGKVIPGGPLGQEAGYELSEQVLTEKLDPRFDIFFLSVVAFEIFTGIRPFDQQDFYALGKDVQAFEPIPFSLLSIDLPQELEGVLKSGFASFHHQSLMAGDFVRDIAAVFSMSESEDEADQESQSHARCDTAGYVCLSNKSSEENPEKKESQADSTISKESGFDPLELNRQTLYSGTEVKLDKETGDLLLNGWPVSASSDPPQDRGAESLFTEESVEDEDSMAAAPSVDAKQSSAVRSGSRSLTRVNRIDLQRRTVIQAARKAGKNGLFGSWWFCVLALFAFSGLAVLGVFMVQPHFGDDSLEALRGIVEKSPSETNTEIMVSGVSSGGSSLSEEEIFKQLESNNTDQLRQALSEVSGKSSEKILTKLIELAVHSDVQVRAQVASIFCDTEAVSKVPLAAVTEVLLARLEDDDPLVRGYAAEALGASGNEDALNELVQRLFAENNPEVVKQIRKAIQKLRK